MEIQGREQSLSGGLGTKTSPILHDLVTRFRVNKCNKYCMKSYKRGGEFVENFFLNADSASPDQSNHKLLSMM